MHRIPLTQSLIKNVIVPDISSRPKSLLGDSLKNREADATRYNVHRTRIVIKLTSFLLFALTLARSAISAGPKHFRTGLSYNHLSGFGLGPL